MKILRGKFLVVAAVLSWLTGCASIGPPLPPSLELPRPPSDLRAARKGDHVTLSWSIPLRTTDRQGMRYLGKTRVCRDVDAPLKVCEKPVGGAAPPADFSVAKKAPAQKLTATFTDSLPAELEQAHPAGFATYAVEVLNQAGRGAGLSNQVRVPLLPTLPPFPSFAAKITRQGVLITWKCPLESSERKSDTRHLFRIYRHPEGNVAETRIAELDVASCVSGGGTLTGEGEMTTSFLDQTFEWENTYRYRGTVVSTIDRAAAPATEVEGDDTPELKVFAHDIFPPAVPSGLQAVFSGPGQRPFIDLIWAPVPDADLDGYIVFRHEQGTSPVKLNSELVKTPAYRDEQVVSGKTYFYSVSAVDQLGNESARSEEGSESVP